MEKNQDSIYVQIMVESLEKKKGILEALIELGKKQEAAFLTNPFDADEFDRMLEENETYLKALEKVEDGFEQMYKRVQVPLKENKESFKAEIQRAQKLISEITQKAVSLEALETRVKSQISMYLNTERKEIKKAVVSKKIATNYYKNMANHHQEGQSYFLDKKN